MMIITELFCSCAFSCIIMSFEDGTMRTLSLAKAANDLPVGGKKLSGKKQPGLHASSYSSFAIWSVHVSRITGTFYYALFLCLYNHRQKFQHRDYL